MDAISRLGASRLVARTGAVSGRVHLLLAAAAVVALSLVKPVGLLVGHFDVAPAVAGTIVSLIASGGYAIDFLFPWVIPFVGTVQAILIAAGTGAAIGW